jgi:hypothetical protein
MEKLNEAGCGGNPDRQNPDELASAYDRHRGCHGVGPVVGSDDTPMGLLTMLGEIFFSSGR